MAGLVGLVLLLAALLAVRFRTDAVLSPTPGHDDMSWARDAERRNSTGHESAEGVIATDNGFCVVGQTNSRQPGVRQAWVLGFNQSPPPRWERVHGKSTSGTATLGRAIAALPGGGCVVAGEEQVAVGRFRGWLLALAADGEILWERTPGHEGINGFTALAVLEDGSIVAGGTQDRAGWVVRLNSRGEPLWDVKLPRLEHVTALGALPAQGLAVLGTAETSTTGLGVSRLVLLHSDGRATGEQQLPTGGRGELNALAVLPEGGLVATGQRSLPSAPDGTLWVVRMAPRGELLWEYIAEGPEVEAGLALTVLPGGDIAVAGYSWRELLVDREARIWRLSAEGHLRWQRTHGGRGDDQGNGIARLADGSLVVVGVTTSKGAGKTDLWTFGVSDQGEPLWEETFGAP